MKPHLAAFDEVKPEKTMTVLEAFLGPEAYQILMSELQRINGLRVETNDRLQIQKET